MRGITYLYDGLVRPMVMALVLLIGAGVLTKDSSAGHAGMSGFSCKGFTNNPELNRTICRYNPARLWNMPITEIIPGLKQD